MKIICAVCKQPASLPDSVNKIHCDCGFWIRWDTPSSYELAPGSKTTKRRYNPASAANGKLGGRPPIDPSAKRVVIRATVAPQTADYLETQPGSLGRVIDRLVKDAEK